MTPQGVLTILTLLCVVCVVLLVTGHLLLALAGGFTVITGSIAVLYYIDQV